MHKKEVLKNKKDEIYLPFKDDKFIKYLRAKYVFLKGKSQTYIKIRPFNSFISDIHFVDTELGLNYHAGKNTSDNWSEYRELIDKKEEYLKVLSKEAYDSMIKMKNLDLQKDICDGISITPVNFSNSDTGFIKIGFKIKIVERSVMGYIDEEIDKYMTENQYV